jgi:peptidoglycan L-alanyl-D-glutamate endopeptidase CwlK
MAEKMTFTLSARSLNNLKGVDERLVDVVFRAIELTKVDFAVIEGVRSPERQRQLYEQGASQVKEGGTHVQGIAVDLMAYLDDRASWELNLYDDIADAMKAAAEEQNVSIRWGGAWTVRNICKWQGTMQSAMNAYIDERRAQGQRPFIDGPHFELT